MKKIQIKTWTGELLFEYEKENNTLLQTLLEAIKSHANLSGADLSDANLNYVNFSHANLNYVNFSGADLSRANLSRANLSGVFVPMYCKWSVAIVDGQIQIGCKKKNITEWDTFFSSNEEYQTKRGTEDFKHIEASYNAVKAYLLTINKNKE